jgi:hypothetical protein
VGFEVKERNGFGDDCITESRPGLLQDPNSRSQEKKMVLRMPEAFPTPSSFKIQFIFLRLALARRAQQSEELPLVLRDLRSQGSKRCLDVAQKMFYIWAKARSPADSPFFLRPRRGQCREREETRSREERLERRTISLQLQFASVFEAVHSNPESEVRQRRKSCRLEKECDFERDISQQSRGVMCDGGQRGPWIHAAGRTLRALM